MWTQLKVRHVSSWIYHRLCNPVQNCRVIYSSVVKKSPSFGGSHNLLAGLCLKNPQTDGFLRRRKFELQDSNVLHVNDTCDPQHSIDGNVEFFAVDSVDRHSARVDKAEPPRGSKADWVSVCAHVSPEIEPLRSFQQMADSGRQWAGSRVQALVRIYGRLCQPVLHALCLVLGIRLTRRFHRFGSAIRRVPCDSMRNGDPHHFMGLTAKTNPYRVMTLLYSGTAAIIAGIWNSPRESQAMRHFTAGGMSTNQT